MAKKISAAKDLSDFEKEIELEKDTEEDLGIIDDDPKTPEEKPADETPKEKPDGINKERQQEQQMLGNARRRVAALEEKLTTVLAEKGESAPATEPVEEDDDPDPLKKLTKLEAREKELTEQVKEQSLKIDKLTDGNEADAETKRYTGFFTNMDSQYGAEHRNEALAFAKQRAMDKGFGLTSESDTPGHNTTRDWIEMGYIQASKQMTTEPVTKTKIREDTHKTGVPKTTSKLMCGSPEEVLADMRANGKFKNLLIED